MPLNGDYSLKKNWRSFFEILESHSPSLPVPCEGTWAFWFCPCLLLRAFQLNTGNFTSGLDARKYNVGGRGRGGGWGERGAGERPLNEETREEWT